jgi:hypothetical protein
VLVLISGPDKGSILRKIWTGYQPIRACDSIEIDDKYTFLFTYICVCRFIHYGNG